ncbi:MAG: dienelactone hydrolase family protein [Steroidobacteraceae bacterium]
MNVPFNSPFNSRIVELYDDYTHGGIHRREFLSRLARLAGGAAAASVILPLLENRYAGAATVAPDDPLLQTGRERFDGPAGPVACYVAWPKLAPERRPAVVVIHENRGLNAHIEDVARRLAVAGFLAVAPDALSGNGGTPADEDEARRLIGELDRDKALAIYLAAMSHAANHARSTGKLGCVGFCWGGSMSGRLAASSPELDAAVVFYGMPPDAAEAARIKVPLLLHYAGNDQRINAAVPAFEQSLKSAHARYELHMYPDVEHAFHNDTNAARYNADAAALAWKRTVEFLTRELGWITTPPPRAAIPSYPAALTA